MTGTRHTHRAGERGGVLLAVVLLITIVGAVSAALVVRASEAACEMRARREVLCARYAALGGLALAGAGSTAGAAALIGPPVSSVALSLVRPAPLWCVLRATARCAGAVRTIERTLADPSACDAAAVPPPP